MSRDGNGVMSVPYPDFIAGTIINQSQVDANNADIVTEITNSIPRDGQAAPTANIPFGTNKITGLGAGSAATDSSNLGQTQAQAYIWAGTAGGTKNALTLSPSPAITAYAAGQTFRFIAGAAQSDDAVTVAISGLTTKAIQSNVAALSVTVYIEASKVYEIIYDGTAFQIHKVSLDALSAATATSATSATSATTAGNVTGTVVVANGGTGLTTLTANNVILGNGTSTPAFVAPSTSGNVLTSNGTTWTSATPSTPISTTAWEAYSPTIVSTTGTLTTASATGSYKTIGKTVVGRVVGSITTNGTGATSIQISLPVTGLSSGISASGNDSLSTKQLAILGDATTLVVRFYDGTYPGANGSAFYISFLYEAA